MVKIKKRFLIETENADYWCDEYKFDQLIGIRTIEKRGRKTHTIHILYPTAVHDFTSELSLDDFRLRKEHEEKIAIEYLKNQEQQAIANSNKAVHDNSVV